MPEPFSQKGRYGVGLASSRGCSGNGLRYVQESDKALPRKRFGHGTLRQAQGVILSNAEGWQDPREFTPQPEGHTREGVDEWPSGGIPLHGRDLDPALKDAMAVRPWSVTPG